MTPTCFSPLAFGTWRIKDWPEWSEAPWVDRHMAGLLELGISTLDTAGVYGSGLSEMVLGRWLQRDPGRRDTVQIVSKVNVVLSEGARAYHYDSTEKGLVAAVDDSLRRLKTDRLDVLMLHREDYLLRPEALVRVLERLERDGKILHFGLSNHSPGKSALIERSLGRPVRLHQIQVSPLRPEHLFDGLSDYLLAHRAEVMAWSPLGGGILMNRFCARLSPVADRYGVPVEGLLMAWLRTHPLQFTPIIGTGSLERARRLSAGASVRLTPGDWYEVLETVQDQPVP